MGRMVPVPGAISPFLRVFAMSNAKIIAIIDAENRAQSSAIEQDLQLALSIADDEIDGVRLSFQQQIDELKQRVAKLEEARGLVHPLVAARIDNIEMRLRQLEEGVTPDTSG
jgi:hypothetical protein